MNVEPVRDLAARYRIERLLGEGGMGRVYRAHDLELDRPVAIKVRIANAGVVEQLLGRFDEEARVCASLDHPHIVKLYDRGRGGDGAHPYIVFEFVEGQDLEREIQTQGRLTVPRTIEVVLGILSGLECAHAQSVIHRDLKPQNILIRSTDGVPKIMDFGLARAASRRGFETQPGIILGTPAYMAPEIIRGTAPDVRSDIYAVGCLIHACLTGKPPFDGRSELEVFRQHLDVAPVPLTRLRPDVPSWLSGLVLKALSKDPGARFESASRMSCALRLATASRSATSRKSRVPAGSRTRPVHVGPAMARATHAVRRTLRAMVLTPTAPGVRNSRSWVRVAALALGVAVVWAALAPARRTDGAAEVRPGSPAATASLREGVPQAVGALGRALADALYDYDPDTAIEKLVTARSATPRGWLKLDLPTFGPALFGSPVRETYDHRVDKRRSVLADGRLREEILAGMPVKLRDSLVAFKPVADRFFGDPRISREDKRTLYAELIRVQRLDLLIRSQLDAAGELGIQELYRKLVRFDHRLGVAALDWNRRSDEQSLFAGGLLWRLPEDTPESLFQPLDTWLNLEDKSGLVPLVLGEGKRLDLATLRRISLPWRKTGLQPATEPLRVRAIVSLLSPSYFLRVRFSSVRDPMDSFELDLCSPGSPAWQQAMENVDAQGGSLDYQDRESRRASFGEVVAHLGPGVLPAPPLDVTISYRHVAPKRQRLLNNLQRQAVTMLVAVTAPGAGGAVR